LLDDATQQATLNEAANVFAAFKSGNIPVARMLLDEKIAAYQNSGNKQGLEKTKALRDMMDTGPDGVKAVEDFFGKIRNGRRKLRRRKRRQKVSGHDSQGKGWT